MELNGFNLYHNFNGSKPLEDVIFSNLGRICKYRGWLSRYKWNERFYGGLSACIANIKHYEWINYKSKSKISISNHWIHQINTFVVLL